MYKTLQRILCAALALLLLAGLCGCGKDKKPKSPPVYRDDVTDYCLITEEISHYKVRVVNPYQKSVFERSELMAVPTVAAVNENELSLFYANPRGLSGSFAVVCNPESGYVSYVTYNALYVKNGYSVSLQYLSDQTVLVVQDMREGGTYQEGTPLEGCNPYDPNITVKEDKDGAIVATYITPAGRTMTAKVTIPE